MLSHLDWPQIGQLTFRRLLLVSVAMGLAILVGVPLGVLMTHFMWLIGPLQGAATVMLTILPIALFGLLMPICSVFGQGLGPLPTITVVFLYSPLPTLRNTYLALTGVEAGTHEAGKGIGTTFRQRLRMIDTPFAVPVILTGVRTAMVMNTGAITIAAVIGAGGLGMLTPASISQSNIPMLVVGAVLVSLLATATDLLLQWLQRILIPKELRTSAY